MAGLIAAGATALKGAGVASTLAQAALVGGTVISTAGALQSGRAQEKSSQYEAAQLTENAKTERALAQRRAEEARRQSTLRISRAKAVAAASGGGQDYALLGDLAEEGELEAQNAIWEGEEAAAGRQSQAAAALFEGSQAKTAGSISGFSTALSGAYTFYDKYG